MSSSSSQHQQGFRHEEVTQLAHLIEAGESVSIIGISGTGKSNLFNHLCHPETQMAYFEQRPFPLIVRVNFHYAPDFTDRTLYSLILEQFEALESEETERLGIEREVIEQISWFHDSLLDVGDDVLKVQRNFKQAIRLLLYGSSRKLVLLFDQFDDVYQEAESRFFANLRGLRETYKYRVCYLLFTRDLLPNLVDLDEAREEFYELMSSNLMGLRPYNEADSLELMRRIGQRNQLAISDETTAWLYAQTGGHAGLLRAAFLAVARQEVAAHTSDHLLTVPGVRLECDKIWHSLSGAEKKALHLLVNQQTPPAETAVIIDQLQTKGVLQANDWQTMFAPVFQMYVQWQDPVWERPLYLDSGSRQVWVLGQPTTPLTSLEYKLFTALYDREGEVLNKDDLIDAGWPTAKGGVSDEALTAAMARLRRKIEPDSKNPQFLQNIRNQGYTLKIEE
jgi:energy-coupling factor transporter ATP-binding protein EcfA2